MRSQDHPQLFLTFDENCSDPVAHALQRQMRKKYDQIFQVLAASDPRGLLDMLGVLPLETEAQVEPLDRELSRDPIIIDSGFVIEDATGKWMAHIEAFAQFKKSDSDRIAWYACDLVNRLRLPIRSTALLLLEKYDPGNVQGTGTIEMGSFQGTHRFDVVKIWQVEAERLLRHHRTHLLSWVPLSKARDEDWIEAEKQIVASGDQQAKATFLALGGLRYGKNIWEQFLERGHIMIRDEILERESWVVQEWIKTGFERGREEECRAMALRFIDSMLRDRFPGLLSRVKRLRNINEGTVLEETAQALLKTRTEAGAKRILDRALRQKKDPR